MTSFSLFTVWLQEKAESFVDGGGDKSTSLNGTVKQQPVKLSKEETVTEDNSVLIANISPTDEATVELSAASDAEAAKQPCSTASLPSSDNASPNSISDVQLGSENCIQSKIGGEVNEDVSTSDLLETISPPAPGVPVKPDLPEISDITEEDDYAPVYCKQPLLHGILKKYKVRNSTWMKSVDGTTTMVTFVVESGRKEEDVLDALITCGIGKEIGTSVSISPLKICFGLELEQESKKKKGLQEAGLSVPSVASTSSLSKCLPRSKASDISLSTTVSATPSVHPSLPVDPPQSQPPVDDSSVGVTFELLKEEPTDTDDLMEEKEEDDMESLLAEDESDFMKSIKARIIIQPVVANLKRNAVFTFDYLIFIILAGIISAVGLVENNSVILVASMLISPLMGPILALTFGSAVQDPVLRNIGIKSEFIGLGICVLTGFLLGLPIMFLMTTGGKWKPSTDSWPSPEMFGRGLPRSLITGAVIAIVSGKAVALSVLGDNQGSLVGVAISASLLPPAVNAGLLWAYSLRSAIYPPETASSLPLSVNASLNGTGVLHPDDLLCPELLNNTYIPQYTCNMAQETFLLGLISLLLTVVNIILIVLAAMLCLKIKQVSPRASVGTEQVFWTKHMKVAKDYNTTVHPSDAFGKSLEQELRTRLQMSKEETDNILQDYNVRKYRLDFRGGLRNRASSHGHDSFRRARSVDVNERDEPEKARKMHRQSSHLPKLESSKFTENPSETRGRFALFKKKPLLKQVSFSD